METDNSWWVFWTLRLERIKMVQVELTECLQSWDIMNRESVGWKQERGGYQGGKGYKTSLDSPFIFLIIWNTPKSNQGMSEFEGLMDF